MATKAARGTKRTCQACEGRFYDLNKTPATCPMCGAVQAKETRDSRRAPQRDEEEDELPVAAMARAGAAGAGAAAGATATGEELPEIVSIEDVPEIEGEDEEIEGGAEETFLEEEEEDGGDVGTLIDNPIEGDEEEA